MKIQCEKLNRPRLLLIVGSFVLTMVAILAIIPAIKYARDACREASCISNLKSINLAMMNYHDEYGCFPPAYVTAKDGKPMHSWRILLLPQLGYDELYKRYSFEEPWNGPNNRLLAGEIPSECRCPFSSGNNTSYLAVVGPEAAWEGRDSVSEKQFVDGLFSTIMVVEVTNSGVSWMEPRDMSFDDALHKHAESSAMQIGSRHRDGAASVMLGLGTDRLPGNTTTEMLRALLTKNGEDESITRSWGN